MAHAKRIKIDELIKKLEAEKAKGLNEVVIYGYIGNILSNENLYESCNEFIREESFAEWQINRNDKF
jgi:hypothetical protein